MSGPEAAVPARASRRPLRTRFPLWLQVLVAILIGIALGAIWPGFSVALKPFGDAFVKLTSLWASRPACC